MTHVTINLPKKVWMNVSSYPCRIQAIDGVVLIQVTTGASPINEDGAIKLQPNFGLTSDEMSEVFLGVGSPTRVWAKSKDLGCSVSVSNA